MGGASHARRASRWLRVAGMTGLVVLAMELLFMRSLLPVDTAVWRAILLWRGCRTDRIVDLTVETLTIVAIAVLAAAAVQSIRRAGVGATWPPLALCALGLLAGKVMKNVLARERPSTLPDVGIGHSFPSGHVMNTTLAALAIVILTAGFRRRLPWWIAAAALLAAITAGRVLLAHHWFLDTVGAFLTGVAMVGLCLPWFRHRPLFAPASLAVVLTAVLALDATGYGPALSLPSPLSVRDAETIEVLPAALLGTASLDGAWEPAAGQENRRSFTWLRGGGTIRVDVPADDGRDAGADAMLAIAGRPDTRHPPCLAVRVGVNGHALPPFVPYVGWREYRLAVPAQVLRAGRNDVRIDVADDAGAPWRYAIAYVRVDLR